MRKQHFGELVQLDASFHHWLEDRAANGCLMHMVDDATGTVLCQFSAGETTWAAAHLLRAWIERYGVPRALYTDWKNVYVRLPNVQERLRGLQQISGITPLFSFLPEIFRYAGTATGDAFFQSVLVSL